MYKFIFRKTADLYIKISPVSNWFFTGLYFLFNIFNFIKGQKLKKEFLHVREFETEVGKDFFLKKHYRYIHDGIQGFPDWRVKNLLVACMRSLSGDCDDFSDITKFMYPDAVVYTILPYNLKYIRKMHVIAIRNGKIYSSGRIHQMALDNYLKIVYNDIDVYVRQI